MCRNDLPGHFHSQKTQAEGGRGMRWELGTLLACHNVLVGFCPQTKNVHTTLALFAWSYHQRNPGRIF